MVVIRFHDDSAKHVMRLASLHESSTAMSECHVSVVTRKQGKHASPKDANEEAKVAMNQSRGQQIQ